ncbi:hypothetical protein E2C01_034967 [Portunus trituberculatus]|uniref:Uncharacterized protein n=1 Tax=Portunus trituberculatus TaxID=210409 RepID=A0A5B7F8E0_PORTR|nr:hypothetical protein [Portunus trituberculatus]
MAATDSLMTRLQQKSSRFYFYTYHTESDYTQILLPPPGGGGGDGGGGVPGEAAATCSEGLSDGEIDMAVIVIVSSLPSAVVCMFVCRLFSEMPSPLATTIFQDHSDN